MKSGTPLMCMNQKLKERGPLKLKGEIRVKEVRKEDELTVWDTKRNRGEVERSFCMSLRHPLMFIFIGWDISLWVIAFGLDVINHTDKFVLPSSTFTFQSIQLISTIYHQNKQQFSTFILLYSKTKDRLEWKSTFLVRGGKF